MQIMPWLKSCLCHSDKRKVPQISPPIHLLLRPDAEGQNHTFRTKVFKKPRPCHLCHQPIHSQGSCCRVCKYACHKACEPRHGDAASTKTQPRSKKPEQTQPLTVTSRRPRTQPTMDLLYVTERIIALRFPADAGSAAHRNALQQAATMLHNKHGDNYMVFNLSEPRRAVRAHARVRELGWPADLAPPLERLCSVCKEIDSWLAASPQHTAVLHARGDRDRIGVVIAAYSHYSAICGAADQALDRFAMQRFFEDKIGGLQQPSNQRYVEYFAGLLSGSIRINAAPLFLTQVDVKGVPAYSTEGGCRALVRVYQGLVPVYSSSIVNVSPGSGGITLPLERPLQLRGDILVKCYHLADANGTATSSKQLVFQCQFHTCAVTAPVLRFPREDLDGACHDMRFPLDGAVELHFSAEPVTTPMSPSMSVATPSDVSDAALARWDSYENFAGLADDEDDDAADDEGEEAGGLGPVGHTVGPVDGSLYATVSKQQQQQQLQQQQQQQQLEQGKNTSSPLPDSGQGVGPISTSTPLSPESPGGGVISNGPLAPSTIRRATTTSSDRDSGLHNGDSLTCPHTASMDSGISSAGNGLSHFAPPSLHHLQSSVSTTSSPPHSGQSGTSSASQQTRAEVHATSSTTPIVDHSALDELLNDMLLNVENIPDLKPGRRYLDTSDALDALRLELDLDKPLISNNIGDTGNKYGMTNGHHDISTHKTVTSTVTTMSVNRRLDYPDESDIPYHARQDSRPFTYGVVPGSPSLQRRPSFERTAAPASPPLARRTSKESVNKQTPGLSSPSLVRKASLRLGSSSPSPAAPSTPPLLTSSLPRAKSPTPPPAPPPMGLITSSPSFSASPLSYNSSPAAYNATPAYSITPSSYNTTPASYSATTASYNTMPASFSTSTSFSKSPVYNTTHSSSGIEDFNDISAYSTGSGGDGNATWLQRQQQKLRERREQQRRVERRPQESRLLVELRSVQNRLHRGPDEDGYASDTTLLSDFGHTSRESSPGKQLYATPLHINTSTISTTTAYNAGSGSGTGSNKGNSAPTSPLLPHRTSSRDRTVRYNQYLSRQKSDTSFDRERPFVAVKRGYEQAKAGGDTDVLGRDDNGSSRPQTPAFPVTPRTPYAHQDIAGLPPRSPTTLRKDRTPSPITVQPNSNDGQSSPSVYCAQSRRSSMHSNTEPQEVAPHHVKFARDTSRIWYRPSISREEAIILLRDKPPGTFVVRNSNSFPGAFGLALKVATPPPVSSRSTSSDPSAELVRHFLIEPTSKGVRLKGCNNEPVFGSLSALVYQHSLTPLALPCQLLLPELDISTDVPDLGTLGTTQQLLAQGAACNVLYLFTMDTESLTGPQALRKTVAQLFTMHPLPQPTIVHFKVSGQGITLTDNERKLFFRRHYPVITISFCGLDPDDHRWAQKNEETGLPVSSNRCFGFVARKPASKVDNQCHVFAELEPEQPASAIVNFVTKVMMTGSSKVRSNMV